jgi:raffinose/stachyose/melibiose transport system substrate-binding protein
MEMFTEDTGIKPELTVTGYGDFRTSLKAALPTGTGPDVFQLNWQVVQPFATEEFVSPLEEMAAAEWGDWESVFAPALVDEIWALGAMDGSGHAYFLPVMGQVLGIMYYRSDIFEETGVSVPETWAELGEVCETLIAGGIDAIVMGGTNGWQHVDWFKELAEIAAPGRIDVFQDGEAKLTDEDLLQTAVLYEEMWMEGWFSEDVAGMDFGGAQQMFNSKEAAMELAGSHVLRSYNPARASEEIVEASNHIRMFLPPGGKGLTATATGYAVTQACEDKDVGWEWMKFWTDGRGQQWMADWPDYVSNVNFEMAKFGTVVDEQLAAPMWKQYQEGPNTLRWLRCGALIDQIGPVFQGVATGQVSPEVAMGELQEVFDTLC